jgi:hypothetical protein
LEKIKRKSFLIYSGAAVLSAAAFLRSPFSIFKSHPKAKSAIDELNGRTRKAKFESNPNSVKRNIG